MRLTVVGCSGSLPGPTSAASCYLVEAQGPAGPGEEGPERTWRILLDLGSGALGPLQDVVDPADLDAVLVSHLHADHVLDLCGLYVWRTFDPRRGRGAAGGAPGDAGRTVGRLLVVGPEGTAQHLARAYGHVGGEELAACFDVQAWRPGERRVVGPVVVDVERVLHPVEAYGIRVTERATGRSLTYTGDTDTCPQVVDLARDVDLLLAEAAFQEGRDVVRGVHLTGRRAGELAHDAGARRLLLTHLPPWNDPGVVLAEAAASPYAGEVSLARPGLAVDV